MSVEKYLRQLLLIGIYMMGVLGIVASGGGGGDGDDDDEDDIVIQAGYTFRIGGPLEDGANSTIGIDKQGAFTLALEPDVVGTVTCDQVTGAHSGASLHESGRQSSFISRHPQSKHER
jgi:hypothetical protein